MNSTARAIRLLLLPTLLLLAVPISAQFGQQVEKASLHVELDRLSY